MTDRQLLLLLGRHLLAAASFAVLITTGIVWSEVTYHAPVPVVEAIYSR